MNVIIYWQFTLIIVEYVMIEYLITVNYASMFGWFFGFSLDAVFSITSYSEVWITLYAQILCRSKFSFLHWLFGDFMSGQKRI